MLFVHFQPRQAIDPELDVRRFERKSMRLCQTCRPLNSLEERPAPEPSTRGSSLIERFKTALKEELTAVEVADEARTVQFYAGLLLVHPNYLNEVVKKSTGKPAIRHIHQQVIDEAKLLLRRTGLSVKEIAYRLAFREPAHFHTFFRKNTLQTPNEYRRHCLAAINR